MLVTFVNGLFTLKQEKSLNYKQKEGCLLVAAFFLFTRFLKLTYIIFCDIMMKFESIVCQF